MEKLPFVFKNAVRNTYFDLLKRFAGEEGLSVDFEHYKDDVIISAGYLRLSSVVAIIDSHSVWGEPDDLTNEYTPMRNTRRTYDGLKIIIKNPRFRPQIEKFADKLKRSLDEEVVIKDSDIDSNKDSDK